MLQRFQLHRTRNVMDTGGEYRLITLMLLVAVLLPLLPFMKSVLSSSPYAPLMYWGALALMIRFVLPSMHVPGKIWAQDSVKGYAVSGAIIYVMVVFMVGVFMKSLKGTPYDLSPLGIWYNIVRILPALIAVEMVRAYALGTAWNMMKYKYTAIVLFTLLIAVSRINLAVIGTLKTTEEIFIYLFSEVMPILAQQVLLSVLVFYGGAFSGVAYMSVVEGFEKFFPVLPELVWLAKATVGIVFPILYAMYAADRCKKFEERQIVRNKKEDFFYWVTLFASVMFLWFSVGVFPIYPSIVLTGSMEPVIRPGDMVLISKIKDEEGINELSVGDVINFKRSNGEEKINITHRIQEIITDQAGNRSFRTKGDNNKIVDEIIVLPNDVTGSVIKVLPKLGMPVLLLRSSDKVPEGVVDHE